MHKTSHAGLLLRLNTDLHTVRKKRPLGLTLTGGETIMMKANGKRLEPASASAYGKVFIRSFEGGNRPWSRS